MFQILVELAIVIVVTAWVLAKALAALGRWVDDHPTTQLARVKPTTHLDFGVLGVILALGLMFFLIVTGAVPNVGHSIWPKNAPDSFQAAMDYDTAASFVKAWETEDPLQFVAFVGLLLLAVCWLIRRSPELVGIALVAAIFILWLRVKM